MAEGAIGVTSTERAERIPVRRRPPTTPLDDRLSDPAPAADVPDTAGALRFGDVGDTTGPPGRKPVPDLADALRRTWGRVPRHWVFLGCLFLGAKLVLTLTGLVILSAHEPFLTSLLPHHELDYVTKQHQGASTNPALSMWFGWDSFIYMFLGSAELGPQWKEFAFPLLYPFLGRAIAPLFGGDIAMALLLVSNVAFVAVLYYAYRLGEQLLGDEAAARRFTKYVVLLPTAFLFQAALTESLFLSLVLATFYYAEREQWVRVGIIGFFLALSRSVGFFVVIPLALVLLQQGRYRLGPAALWGYVKTGWPLVLLPAGWLSFMAFCKIQGDDWFAYKNAQEKGWSIKPQNPLATLWDGLTTAGMTHAVRVWFAVVVLGIILAAAVKYLKPGYVAYALLMVLIPLSMGPPVYGSLLRYLVVVFPVALVFAQWARRPAVDTFLTGALPLIQGALFVTWLNYWTHFII